MRFMVMVKADEQSEAGVMPDEKLLSAMGRYNEELAKAGVLVTGEGLKPSSKGTRVRLSQGKSTLVDGPFAEAKELVAGYWIIQAKSKEEAIDWIKRVPFDRGEIEIRPLHGPDADQANQPGPARKPGTTRYAALLKADKLSESGALPTDEKVFARMDALIERMSKTRAYLTGAGLKASSEGTRVQFSGEKRTVIDGPFTESKELIAGFGLIQVPSKEEATNFAREWLEIHVEGCRVDAGEIELRPLLELEDFAVDPEETPDGWRQKEARAREGAG